MSFQTIPPQADLQASIPAGRMAVAIKSYAKPTPAFGPGSPSYVEQMAEQLERLEVENGDEAASATPSPPVGRQEAAYAGAGQYY